MFVRQKDFGAMTFMEMEVRRSAAATRHCNQKSQSHSYYRVSQKKCRFLEKRP